MSSEEFELTMSDSPLTLSARGLKELMRDENELSLFAKFKDCPGHNLHSGFRRDVMFDSQKAAFRPKPSS